MVISFYLIIFLYCQNTFRFIGSKRKIFASLAVVFLFNMVENLSGRTIFNSDRNDASRFFYQICSISSQLGAYRPKKNRTGFNIYRCFYAMYRNHMEVRTLGKTIQKSNLSAHARSDAFLTDFVFNNGRRKFCFFSQNS